jgi:hypothetical protein
MSILKKRNILKLATTFMLMGMMAGAFVMHSSAAFAATAIACDPALNISGNDTTTGVPNCDVAVTPNGSVPITGLSFTSVGDVVDLPNPIVGHNTFTFAAVVTDVRDTNEGWQLQAASPGLHTTTGTHTANLIPLTVGIPTSTGVTGSTSDCTLTPDTTLATNTDCPTPVITQITLSTTPTTFVTETPSGTDHVNPLSGVSDLGIAGSYELPIGTYPGAYSGAITLSLLNTFA